MAFVLVLVAFLPSCRWFRWGKKKSAQSSVQVKAKGRAYPVPKWTKPVLDKARSYVGTPYRLGGSSSAGIDCSGLVFVAFQQSGLSLPRSSAEQANVGKKLNAKEVRVGDLAFFADPKYGKGITHVGIISYSDDAGELKMVHASNSIGVVEVSLSVGYFQKTLHHFSRVVD